ncbi:MAG: hypothetical protein ACPF9E_19190 [Alteromonas oceani]
MAKSGRSSDKTGISSHPVMTEHLVIPEFVQQISGNSLHGNVLLKQQSKNTVSVRQATWEIPAQKLAGMTREEYAGMTKIFSRVMATFSGDSARRLR